MVGLGSGAAVCVPWAHPAISVAASTSANERVNKWTPLNPSSRTEWAVRAPPIRQRRTSTVNVHSDYPAGQIDDTLRAGMPSGGPPIVPT